MSDGKRSVSTGDAFAILVTLASETTITEEMVAQDPVRLAPIRTRQMRAFDVVEAFLRIHLYGDCKPCA